MGVQFLSLDAPSRETLNRMLARKAAPARRACVRAPMPAARPRRGIAAAPTARRAARIDTNVDLAAELGDRRGAPAARGRPAPTRRDARAGEIDELEALLKPEPIEPVGIAQALAELPRLLDPNARRMTGAFRPLGDHWAADAAAKVNE